MRLLFVGDVLGRPGRDAIETHLPALKRELKADFVVVNGENSAHGAGITGKICEQLMAAGADVITGGNHSWDQREALSYIEQQPRLLRPHNYPVGTPGRGAAVFTAAGQRKVLVLNLMARLFMDPLDDPFAMVDRELQRHRLGHTVNAIILDFHGEATSEKMAMGHHVDGRVSLCVGTHTHVPTADTMILDRGTAYQTDAGMTGPYNSVIGMETAAPIQRFTKKIGGGKLNPADDVATLCGTFVETDDRTGLARRIEPVRVGGRLAEHRPAV
jgi:metallophosphoesterase (TIGR00282 family)